MVTPHGYDMWEMVLENKKYLTEGLICSCPSEVLLKYICAHFKLTNSDNRSAVGDFGYAYIDNVMHINSDNNIAAQKINIYIENNIDEIVSDIENNIGVFGWFISTDSRKFIKNKILRPVDYVELTLSQKVEYSECKIEDILQYKHIVHITYNRKVRSILDGGLTPRDNNGLFSFNNRVYFFCTNEELEVKNFVPFMKALLLRDGYIDRFGNVTYDGQYILKRSEDFLDFSVLGINKNYFVEKSPIVFVDDKYAEESAYFVEDNIEPKYINEIFSGYRLIMRK